MLFTKYVPVRFYFLICALALSCLLLAFFTNNTYLIALPFIGVFLLAALFFLDFVYLLLIFVIPFSIEYYIGNLSTDLPSEPMAVVIMVFLFFYLLTQKTQLKFLLSHQLTVILFLLWIWAIVATIFSTDILISIKYLAAKTWYITAFYIAAFVFTKTKDDLEKQVKILLIPTVVAVCVVMVRHAMLGFSFDTINKACTPIFRNHVNYAIFIAMLLPYIVYLWYISKKSKWIYTLIIILFFVAIFFTYTRGVWLSLAVLPLVLAIIYFKRLKIVLLLVLLSASMAAIYLAHNNNYLKYAPNFSTTIYHNQLNEHLTATFSGEDMSTMERFHRWIAALRMSKINLLNGTGPNTFVANYKSYTVSSFQTYISENEEKSTVHNYILLMLAEQGILAALLYCILLIFFYLNAQKYYHLSSSFEMKFLLLMIVCSQTIFFVNNLFSDLVESNKVGAMFFINIAWIVCWQRWRNIKANQIL